jgi:hypothetical protein
MAFRQGDRVVLLEDHDGIEAGSLGTVKRGDPATSIVNFDIDQKRDVFVRNGLLRKRESDTSEAPRAQTVEAQGQPECPDPPGTLRWSLPRVIAPGVGIETSFAPVTAVPNVLSLLFQGAEVVLDYDLRLGELTSGSWIGTVEFPVTGGPAALRIDVRGHLTQPDGARSSITIVVGGHAHIASFTGSWGKQELFQTFTGEIGAEPLQTITAILLAERPRETSEVLLVLDSVDIVKSELPLPKQSEKLLPPTRVPGVPRRPAPRR